MDGQDIQIHPERKQNPPGGRYLYIAAVFDGRKRRLTYADLVSKRSL